MQQPDTASIPGSTSSLPDGQQPVPVPTPFTPLLPPPAPTVIPTPSATPNPNPILPEEPTPSDPQNPISLEPPVFGPSPNPSLDFLEGLRVYGAQPGLALGANPVPNPSDFLGTLSRGTTDPESLANPSGIYGQSGSVNSIFNPLSPVGSPFNPRSAFNRFAFPPPFIMNGDVVVGRLTVNTVVPDQIDSCDVIEWLGRQTDRSDVCS